MEHNSQTQQIEVFSRPQSPLKSTHRELDSYNTLHETQIKIQQQINTWDELNKVFRKKQQQSFYITFNEIMEKMAKQLAQAQQKYQQIDKEIKIDERCQRLEKQVHFFREECLVLRDQVGGLKKQIKSLRIQNQGLKDQSFVLKKKLNKRAQVFALDKSVCGQTRFNSTATKSFYITQKSKIDQQDAALEGLVYNLKSNDPRQGVKLIKRFIKNQVRNIQTPLIQRRIKNSSTAKKTLYKSIIDQTDTGIMVKNQYLELWSDCVKQFKINKKMVKTMPKQSKFKLLQSFLSSEKFIQLLRIKIFGQKCCTNWNCLGNLQSNPYSEDSLINSPPKRVIQTADKAFRNTYNKRNTGTNKNKIFHLDNNCFWN